MTADLWATLPEAITGVDSENVVIMLARAEKMLDHGGSVALHFVASSGDVMRTEPRVFDDWCAVLELIAPQGNAVLIAFLRATPPFIRQTATLKLEGEVSGSIKTDALRGIFRLIANIAEIDAESALAAFRSSAGALRNVSVGQYEKWVIHGLREMEGRTSKTRRSYFALETRQSNDSLRQTRSGLHLDSVSHVLRLYIEALTGHEIDIASLNAMPQGSRIGDGKTVYLPDSIAENDTDEMDFRLYKVLAAYGAGQVEFGTFVKDTVELKAAFTDLADLYSATAEEIDAFSLAGYIEDVQKGERALSDDEIREEIRRRRKSLPKDSDYRAVLAIFPEPALARKIFTTMENARIDALLSRCLLYTSPSPRDRG
jgi:hypothetical protein